MRDPSVDRVDEASGNDRSTALLLVAGAAVVASIVAAAIRALASDWYPVGDNALFALRGRDVLTEHHPLVGTSTSASELVGVNFNNPGPLLFDLYAWAAKLGPGFLPLGVAAVALGSIALMGVCAHRVAGRRGLLLALFSASALAWAMGPELLIDPWQPHSLLFPFLALIATTWAVWAGSDGALVAVAALSSLIVQTHLSYAPLVGVLAAAATVAVLIRAVRRPAGRRRAARLAAVTVALLVVLWAQPLWEQVRADDEGNLARIAEVPGSDRGESVGLRVAAQVAGTMLAPLPRWAPPAFEDAYEQAPLLQPLPERFERVPSLPVAVGTLVATFAVLGAVGALAHRRGAPMVAAGAGVVGATVATAVLTTAMLPVGVWGLPPHHIRWLWPAAIAITAVVASVALTRRVGVLLVAGATVAMSVLAMAPTHPDAGPAGATDVAGPAMRALVGQLDDRLVERGVPGPVLLETGPLGIDDQYTVPLLLELDRTIEVRVEDPVLIRQLGDARAATGAETGRLVVTYGSDAGAARPGWERVAFVRGLSAEEDGEYDRLRRTVSQEIRGQGLRLTARGRAAVGSIGMPPVEEVVGRDIDPLSVLDAAALQGVVTAGFVVAPDAQADLARWADLHRRSHGGTAAVWLRMDAAVPAGEA